MQLVPSDYFKKLPKEAIFTEIDKPLEIDLGCGEVSFLVAMASKYPGKNFLGVERLICRVRKVLRKSE